MKQIKTILIIPLLFISLETILEGRTRLYNEKVMSSSLTTAITQDSMGYIWIGTEYGLNRFDGISFKEYLHNDNDPTSIKSNIVRSMLNDKDGRLWIGYLNGIQLYDPMTDSFNNVSFDTLKETPNIAEIHQLSSGKIWVEVSMLGIYEIDPVTMSARKVTRLGDLCGTENFLSIFEDNNRIWISTSDRGLICVDSELTKVVGRYFQNRRNGFGGQMAINKDNVLILSYGGSIYMFDEVHKEFILMTQSQKQTIMAHDLVLRDNGDFILSTTNQGLWKINEETRTLEKYEIEYPEGLDPTNARIVNIMEDRGGNLWLGSFQQGVIMVPDSDDGSFRQWKLGTPSSIYKTTDGYIWCGTQDGHLYRLDEEGNVSGNFKTDSEIRCISEDSRGNLWIGVRRSGLYKIAHNTGKMQLVDGFRGRSITDVAEDSRNTLYISVSNNGIIRYETENGRSEQMTQDNTENFELLRNNNINKLFIDSKDRLWVGHYLGVSCYDTKERRFIDIATDSLLNTSVCYAINQAEDGKILIGSNNGLFIYDDDNGKYIRYTTDHGLSSDMICGVVEDSEGNIWCSTFRGINCVSKKDNSIISWYASNGMSKREYIRTCYHTDGRNIYFGELSGITAFETPVKTTQKRTEIILTGFQIGNNDIPVGSIKEGINLSHRENTFSLELSPMSFTEDAIRIHYRLLGLSSSWNTTRYGVNQVIYNNLKPGKYVLEAYSEENGIKSETFAIPIQIKTPWFKSIWAYILYTMVIIMLVVVIYTGQKRKLRERSNNQRLKHYINLAHEIRTPMVMITNPLDTLMKNSRDPETTSAILTMKRNTDRIVRTLDQFLEIRRLDTGNISIHRRKEDLVKLINDSLSYFTYQAKKKNISMKFEHAMEAMNFSIDASHLDTILYNLINNSLKYTPEGGEIIVNLKINDTDGNAVISVSDSGMGIDEKNVKKIFNRFYQDPSLSAGVKGFGIGLNLCQMLVELHGGKITASNRIERSGAVFTITIPDLASSEESDTVDPAVVVEDTVMNNDIQQEEVQETENTKKIKPKKSERILIVDDDEEIRAYLEEQLSPIYKTSTANDGDIGIQKALTEIPDLIISDIRMPGTDGYQLVKKLKGNSNTTHIPIILLTSKNDLDDKIIGLEHGADNYIAKPFHMAELKIMIENILKNRQRIRGKYSGAYQEDKIKEIELESDDEVLMKRIMKVVNDNLDNTELKVEMLSKEIGLSRVQLHRRMKEITGISTGEFIRNIRLKKAAELLSEKKVNVSQVAYMVGFSSHTHFSTAFRKFYGMSPTEYINK